MIAERLAYFQAIDVGQHDVQDHQVRPLTSAEFHGALAGLCAREPEAFLLKVVFRRGKRSESSSITTLR